MKQYILLALFLLSGITGVAQETVMVFYQNNDNPHRYKQLSLEVEENIQYEIKDYDPNDDFFNDRGFHIEDYTFVCWEHDKKMWYPGDEIQMDENKYFTAQWAYIVSYDTQGGSKVKSDSLVITIGDTKASDVLPTVEKPSSDPTREGYAFKGWYMEKGCTTPYEFGNILKSNITLYAKWESLEVVTPEHYYTLPLTVAPGIWCNYAAGDLTVSEKDHLFLQFYAEDGKTTEDILFMVDGVETAFKKSNNAGSYILNPITRDHTILIAQRQYRVTIPPLDGASCDRGSGEHLVDYGAPFRFSLTFDEGQDPQAVQVLANGIVLSPSNLPQEEALRASVLPVSSPIGGGREGAVVLAYTLDQVTGPVEISVEGLLATSNAALEQGVRVVVESGKLKVESEGPAVDVAVYGIAGQSVVQLRGLRGSKTISLAPGVYIVRAGKTTTKVMING